MDDLLEVIVLLWFLFNFQPLCFLIEAFGPESAFLESSNVLDRRSDPAVLV